MDSQDKGFMSAYGEAMLYSHLIEDLLKLILRDASFFHVNAYKAPSPLPWRLEEIIAQFGKAFPDSGKLVANLELLRKIRNKLTHALLLQVGSDLSTEEGRDQIHAMLKRYNVHACAHREILGNVFETILARVIEENPTRIFEHEYESLKDRFVSNSDIQRLLDELEG